MLKDLFTNHKNTIDLFYYVQISFLYPNLTLSLKI